ncbi:hypothetical protein PMAYCL1PPCAC_10529, partial [Pristionchus mayeri]
VAIDMVRLIHEAEIRRELYNARRMLTIFQNTTHTSLHAFIREVEDIIAVAERTLVLCLPPIAA